MRIEHGSILLAIARGAIARSLGAPAPEYDDGPWLTEPGASFVTLMRRGELRGCIGSLMAERPLRQDIESNALAAAFRDPRFPPVALPEYADIAVEVSVLSALEPIAVENEAQLLTLLRPGIDGVLLEYGSRRSTFLPQVWEQLPEPRAFLAHLKQKAGLHMDFWAEDIRLSRYTVTKWRETEPHDTRAVS
jgi:AmmeMemoRadiSam system protein A